MALSSDLASQFAKVTNDSGDKSSGIKLYGTIKMLGKGENEIPYVKLDGTEELTPISRTVEVAESDRVEVMIANHSATVTGNLTDPSIGVKRAGNLESKITQTAEEIQLQVSDLENNLDSKITQTSTDIRSEVSDLGNNLDSKITQNANSISTLVTSSNEFSEFKQTVEGFSFMNKGGTVKISGGNLDLTGAITFSDFNSATQTRITNVESTASTALTNAGNAWDRAGTAIDDAYDAYSRASTAINNAKAIANGAFSGGTLIDKDHIKSPVIVGGQIFAVDETSYAQMTSNGLYMYTNGHKNPKVRLTYSSSDADNPQVDLILGAGSDNDSVYKNRFFIQKGTDRTGLWYYDSNGKMSGLTFMAGGQIVVHGTGLSYTSIVSAVWG